MKIFLPALLAFSSALFPAMGNQPAPQSTERATIVFSHPKLATPLSEEQQEQAGLLLCRIHDRASADAAAADFAILLDAVEGKISHWTQFGHTRFWEDILPAIAAADYYGSDSLKTLFVPLISPDSEEREAAAPYALLIQDVADACAELAVMLDNTTDAETARKASEAVQACTDKLPEWRKRADEMPRARGNAPMLLNVKIHQAKQHIAHLLRAWAQLELRSTDAYGEATLLTKALPGLAVVLQNTDAAKVPEPDRLSELYNDSITAIPLIRGIIAALMSVTDKESADAAALTLENNFRSIPRTVERWLKTFYPESECLLRQLFTLHRALELKNPPFYGSEKLQHAFDGL